MNIKSVIILLSLFALPLSSLGQQLSEKLDKVKSFEGSFITEYLHPLSIYIGNASSSSISSNAKSVKFPHIRLGLSYAYLKIKNKDKYFVYNEKRYQTLFGNENDSISGLNMNNLSLPVAQVNLGLGDEFELIGRYMQYNQSKLGKIKVAGIGVKYELEDFFNIQAFPIDMAILALYQKLFIGKDIEGAIFQMGVSASKLFSNLGLFTGLNYVNNTLNYEADKNTIYSINGLDKVVYHAGILYKLKFVVLSSEYSFNSSSLSFNLSLIF